MEESIDMNVERKKEIILTSTRLKIAYGTDCFFICLMYSALFLLSFTINAPSFSTNPSLNRLSQELAASISA